MNVLLVDDEQHVREAIRLLIDWQGLGIDNIYEADNGDAAVDMIERLQPEIVVTDMRMPHRDGVGLLSWLYAEGRKCKTIVVSGYDDFELVRSSMKYGGQDYLLKPIDPEQLTEALVKAKQCWEKEERERQIKQQRNIEMNQIKPVYWDKLFSGLISQTGGRTQLPPLLQDEFKLSRIEQCRTAVLSLDSIDAGVAQKFVHNRDLLFFILTNVCNEFLRRDDRGFAFRYWNSEHEIVLLLWGGLGDWEATLRRIRDGICETIHSRIDIGIGTEQPFPGGIADSFQAARTALKQRNLLAADDGFHCFESSKAITSSAAVSMPSLGDYEERFRVAARGGREKDIETAVNSWMEAVSGMPAISQGQLEHWHADYKAMLERLNKPVHESSAAVTVFDSSWRASSPELLPEWRRLLHADRSLSMEAWREQLIASLSELSRIYQSGSSRQPDLNIMKEIAKYMEQNYHLEVTLQDISERFYLSREYISRRFKQEMGENVFDYLARVRVEKARLLLRNPHLKIAQIAEMVGYDDEKYFSKVFKKVMSVSPNQYRKQEGEG
ncbi:response regulator [Paenibacillus sp. NPDC058174]|uniref:response regulator n=1 Tax=Paenibacillus sp. NPDC058174 TaxID=3346366 RepID=UPI0036DABDAC